MNEAASDKALAIHRIVQCKMDLQPGRQPGKKIWNATGPSGNWHHSTYLQTAVRAAFREWEQAWRVKREMNQESFAGMSPTDVLDKPPADFYKVPDRFVKRYAKAYDIISFYRPRWDRVGVLACGNISGDGLLICEKAESLAAQMQADCEPHIYLSCTCSRGTRTCDVKHTEEGPW